MTQQRQAAFDAMRDAAQQTRNAVGELRAAAGTARDAVPVGALPGFKTGIEALAACVVVARLTDELAHVLARHAATLDATSEGFDDAEIANAANLEANGTRPD